MPAPVGDYFVVFPNTQLPLAIAGILGWGARVDGCTLHLNAEALDALRQLQPGKDGAYSGGCVHMGVGSYIVQSRP